MRKAETAHSKKLLLLSLIPMLAFGVVEYVDQRSEVSIGVAYGEPALPAPVENIPIDQAPGLTPDDGQCHGCVMSL